MPDVHSDDVAFVLDYAAEIISVGWIQCRGAFAERVDGSVTNDVYAGDVIAFDLVGAIRRACWHDNDLESAARRAVGTTIRRVPLISWNDAPDRTQADVVRVLRASAESARRIAA